MLISQIKNDNSQVEANMHRIPGEVQMELMGESFVMESVEKFNAIDTDQNGVLTPEEVHCLRKILINYNFLFCNILKLVSHTLYLDGYPRPATLFTPSIQPTTSLSSSRSWRR